MSIVTVQCAGSGKQSTASVNAKRALCGICSHMQDVRPDGKFRKHKRLTRTRHLR